MKKYNIIIAYLLVCFACSKTEHVPEGGNEEFIINAGISTIVQGGEISRADSPESELFIKDFDLFLTQTEPEDREFGPEVYHAKHASSNYNVHKVTGEKLYWDNIGGVDAELDFFGIHPQGKIKPDQLSFAVLSDQSSDTKDLDASDLKISNKATGYTLRKQKGEGIKTLEFQHLLSKITLVLTPDDGFEGESFEPNPTLLDFYTTCSVNISTLSTHTHGTSINIIPKKISEESRIKTYTAIVVPGQSFAKDGLFGKIKLEVGDTEQTYNLKMPEAILIEKGKNYLFEVTVKKSTIEIEASLADWELVTVGENNEVKIGFDNVKTPIGNEAIKTNSELLIDIDGKQAHYIATGVESSIKWEYKESSKKIYWDNIKTSTAPKANAVLWLGTSIDANSSPENIYIGESQPLDKVYNYIQFEEMTHPFSRINLTIKSLKAGDERVNLSNITKISSNGLYKFNEVITTYSDDFLNITYHEDDNAEFKLSVPEDKDNDNKFKYYVVDPLYIKPGKIFAKGDKLLEVIVQETPVESTNIVNTYPFYIPVENGVTFEANKEYNITITLYKTEIVDMEVSITGWGKTDDIDGSGTIDNK